MQTRNGEKDGIAVLIAIPGPAPGENGVRSVFGLNGGVAGRKLAIK